MEQRLNLGTVRYSQKTDVQEYEIEEDQWHFQVQDYEELKVILYFETANMLQCLGIFQKQYEGKR